MLQNLHTHSTFCDGRDTPEQMIETALSLGFDSIGFSSHAKSEAELTRELSSETIDDYHKTVNELREKYRDRIKIYLGTELDRYSEGHIPDFKYDYTIGSTHAARYEGQKISYDMGLEKSKRAIDEILHGNRDKYVKLYYETLSDMPRHISFDIVGHFDLLTKYSEKDALMIDTESVFYRSCALEALHSLREHCELFEINTGAIGRGYRTTPYPAPFILKEMRALGCKMVLSSDCHDRRALDCGFSEAKELLKSCGINELYYLGDNGFFGEKIV